MKKKDYNELDSEILRLIEASPAGHDAIKTNEEVRRSAILVTRRRSGASPADSTDTTIMERLNALRLVGGVHYDHSSKRWSAIQSG